MLKKLKEKTRIVKSFNNFSIIKKYFKKKKFLKKSERKLNNLKNLKHFSVIYEYL